jgi:iron complex outermembrane receptor protein
MKKYLFLIMAMALATGMKAQDSLGSLLSLSIEKLMDIPIYSASKEEETIFDAPLASYVVTREQMMNAGCTSIMEALRLVPGVIVRQQTNGNYDIHIRGLDNVPPNSNLVFLTNSTTLVMIDERPVYNYLHGGTFWETLPISIHDVERIEVVEGPAAAIYGPNAVSGVINIITRNVAHQGKYASARAQYGSYNSFVSGAAIGYKAKDKLSAIVTGNYSSRDRTQSDYYDIRRDKYVPLDSVTSVINNPLHNTSEAYPDPDQALKQYGLNAMLNYTPKAKTSIALSVGGQESTAQKEFGQGLMPVTTATSSTRYVDLNATLSDFHVEASHVWGTQEPALGQRIWRWDLNTTDAVAEYNIKPLKNLTIRPGIMYRSAIYDDSKYVNTTIRQGLWSGTATSETRSASLRLDYKTPDNKLRLIAAGRLDKFNYPSKTYYSYQLVATYKIDKNNLVRLEESRANRTPLLIDLFSNLDLTGAFPLTRPGQTYLLQLRGNKNIKLLTSEVSSAGYRSRLTKNVALDVEAFYSRTKDFSDLVTKSVTVDSTAQVALTEEIDIDNLNVQARQWGVTLSLDYTDDKLEIKPFITLQRTNLLDYSPYNNTASAPPTAANHYNPAENNVNSNEGTVVQQLATPSYYGGAYINWKINNAWNLNATTYLYGKQTQTESSNLTYNDGKRGVEHIAAKVLINLAAQYKITKQLTAFATLQNCLNDKSREFYKGDQTAFMAFGGLNFELQ